MVLMTAENIHPNHDNQSGRNVYGGLVLYRWRVLSMRYFLCILACIGSAACSKPPPAPSTGDLRSFLRPPSDIGTYAGFDLARSVLYLGNSTIERRFRLDEDGNAPHTSHYIHKPSKRNYVSVACEEFRLRIGETVFTANTDTLKYKGYKIKRSAAEKKLLIIELEYSEASGEPIGSFKLHYEVYPNLPVIRKWITIENLTVSAFFVEDIIIESLTLPAKRNPQLQAVGNRPGFPVNSQPVIFVHDREENGGIVLGNEAPGILKYCNLSPDDVEAEIEVGLSPTSAINGFEIRVPPNTLVSTPKIWTMLFEGDYSVVSGLLRNVLDHRLISLEEEAAQKRSFTWTNVSSDETMHAGDFIVADYNWNGDNLSTLQQMSQQIHEKGGKFGIRLPIAEIDVRFLNRSTWRLAPVASLGSLTAENNTTQNSAPPDVEPPSTANGGKAVYCVLCDYGYYLSHAVHALLDETEAEFLVFDGSLIGLPGNALKGCGVLGHEHLSRKESVGLIYQWVFDFADHLRLQYPNLQLGITSAAYGVDVPDIAVLNHFDLFFPKRD